MEGVNALVAMLGCRDLEKMSLTFEAMSSSPDNCELMRGNRVVPVLVGVLHGHGGGQEVSKLDYLGAHQSFRAHLVIVIIID